MALPIAIVLAGLLATQAQSSSLRIVVVEGEDAVNVVQQKTAVRPLVEIRDRNNLPVPGATVTFTIGTGQPAAFAGGAQTLTVTTNAAGQAAAGGFNVVGAGSVQIQVQAAYQGQIATAAISQTNYATAAAAAQAGAGGGSASGTAGGTAAAGGGGGLSATTIGIVGAAVAGGAVAATQTGLLGGDVTYTGSLNGQYVWSNSGSTGIGTPIVCNFTRSISGKMTLELNDEGTSGRGTISMTHTDLSVSGQGCNANPGAPLEVRMNDYFAVGGGPSALSFSVTEKPPGNANRTDQYTFSGSLSGDTITGTFTWRTSDQTASPNGTFTGSGSFTIPVTLQR